MDTLVINKSPVGVEPPPVPFDDPPGLQEPHVGLESVAGTPSDVSTDVRDFVAKKTRALYHELDDHPKGFARLRG